MVIVNLIMEGASPTGVLNSSAMLMDNTSVFRQSLNKFFQRVLNRSDIRVVVDMGANKNSAVYKYARNKNAETFLYVDLDAPAGSIPQWFSLMEKETTRKGVTFSEVADCDKVFFMIQEMEAWFLKQPVCIERWASTKGYIRDHSDEDIGLHSLIRGKDIESIGKPSDKLALIIRHFFSEQDNAGKKGRKVKYHKLKSAPGLIDALSAETLLSEDKQLRRFKAILSSYA